MNEGTLSGRPRRLLQLNGLRLSFLPCLLCFPWLLSFSSAAQLPAAARLEALGAKVKQTGGAITEVQLRVALPGVKIVWEALTPADEETHLVKKLKL